MDTDQAFRLKPTTYDEVKKIILNLRNDCSSGYDSLPVKFLKPVYEYITSPLVHIINNCIKTGTFPNQWKIARVCPIPKVKNPSEPKDFRPVSILPVLSKVFEKVILNQMLTFVENNIYNKTQSGFRKGHSTTTLLLKLRDDIKFSMNRNEVTLAVMIDYSKAFDTIDHSILIQKLSNLNFGKSLIKVIISYLSNRKQFVQIDENKFSIKDIFFGVPQGSILGPILFNIYVSELPDIIRSPSIQYADDTALYRSCKKKDIIETIKHLENGLTSLSNWSNKDGLVFHNNKLQMILMGKPRSLSTDCSFLMRSDGKSVRQESSVRLLEVTFDENLF